MRRARAFTLIELLVVITIIGILMALVVVTVQPIQRRSRDSKRKADVNLLLASLNQFQVDYKIYPNYTYLLGTTTTVGEKESFFNLGADLAACTNLGSTTAGYPSNFIQSSSEDVGSAPQIPANPSTPFDQAADYNTLVTRPGFRSVNHLLICLKYLDRLIVDPRPLSTYEDYQYQVSYDYQNVLVSARMENANDSSAVSQLFPGVTESVSLTTGGRSKRYFEGNGRFIWQFDEGTDGTFSGLIYSRNLTPNGRYFYQCRYKTDLSEITRDNRTLTQYQPFISGLTSLNSQCRQYNVSAKEYVPTN